MSKLMPEFRAGDRTSARKFNRMSKAIDRLNRHTGINTLDIGTGIFNRPNRERKLIPVQIVNDLLDHVGDVDELDLNESTAYPTTPWSVPATQRRLDAARVYAGGTDDVRLTNEKGVAFYDDHYGQYFILPFTQWHLARLDATLNAGSSAQVTIWEVVSGVEQATSPAVTVTAYDFMLPTGESIDSGTDVIIVQHRQSDRWYVLRIDADVAIACGLQLDVNGAIEINEIDLRGGNAVTALADSGLEALGTCGIQVDRAVTEYITLDVIDASTFVLSCQVGHIIEITFDHRTLTLSKNAHEDVIDYALGTLQTDHTVTVDMDTCP